ncbi:hypothetical protein GGI07_003678 [Coemansia sp. Benny D115]|nr:hypothetical protein GGI07_003678 [Coemansia sp. Benny D115]
MLRGRNPLDHSIFAQQAESTEHCEHHQSQLATSASVPASGTNHHSIRNVMPLTALNRPRQESVGISESRPSSLSSANDRAAIAKTPTFEYYGFVIYLVSLVSFVLYLMWAYLPDSVLGAVGITYYPDRYWALALPAWWLTVVAFAYLFNMAANMYNTPLLNSMDNIVDPYSNLPKNMAKAAEFYSNEVGGIPPVSDIPISLVNKCLYEEDAEPL